MNLTVNQALNLLYIHHREPSHNIGLSESEIVDLTLYVVSRYHELTSVYKDQMIPQSKVELVDVLRSTSGASGIFQTVH